MFQCLVPKRMAAPFVNDLLQTFETHLQSITIIIQARSEDSCVLIVISSSSEDAVKEWTRNYYDWPQIT